MSGFRGKAEDPSTVLLGDCTELHLEQYGWDSAGTYYKARLPGGGTIEVHMLNESYFDGHPSAWDEEE